jgi:hypothetical protein
MITNDELLKSIFELKNSQKETDRQMKETDRQMKETDRQMKETDRKLDKIGKLVGSISNNQGDIAEEFFYNSLKHKPFLAGVNYDFIDKNVTRSKQDTEDEYDILMVNGKDIAIIETKYKAHLSDLERLLHKKYTNFKILYPEYKQYNHHLVLASFHINDNIKNFASKHSITLLTRKGDIIQTINP